MQNKEFEISCNSRLHLGLFSMHENGVRINGGIGFAIELPEIRVQIKPSSEFSIHDFRKKGVSGSAVNRLLEKLENAYKKYSLHSFVSIEITGDAESNHGFGTGTAIRLASIEGLMLVNNKEISNDELVKLSGRGGTSGIGINTYFSGGLVIDLGRLNDGQKKQPSSQVKDNVNYPLLLKQSIMPDWSVGICIPSNIASLNEEEEKRFFDKTCPISEFEAYKTIYHSLMGVYASVEEGTKSIFEDSIKLLQNCEWKKEERGRHGVALLEIEKDLYKFGANVVGMSSLGPSLFFLADNVQHVIKLMKKSYPDYILLNTKASNQGRVIKCLN